MNNFHLGRIPLWIAVLIVIVAVAVIVLWLLGTKNPLYPAEKQNPENEEVLQENSEQNSEQVFSYIGKISSIESGEIKIAAESTKNSLDKNEIITILLNDQTKYYKVVVPKTLPENPEENKPLFSRAEIAFSDLAVGMEITAVSTENIFGKTEFIAKKIEVVIAE